MRGPRLATIYKRYGTRDELILAALDCWMEENRYAGLTKPHDPDESIYVGVMRVLRTIFEPWEHHPAMLKAYFRARTAPGGKKLVRRGFDAVVPAVMEVLADADPEFVRDMDTIVSNVVYGLLGRFAAGEIEITEIVPSLDRTVEYLTTNVRARDNRCRSFGRGRAPNITRPPSTAISCPLMKRDPSPHKNTSVGPRSLTGSPSAPPRGIVDLICSSMKSAASGPRNSRRRAAPGVCTAGASAIAETFSAAQARAMERVHAETAPFVAAYTAEIGLPITASPEPKLMIRPPPPLRITAYAAWLVKIVALRLVSTRKSMSSPVI